jgi:pyruvate kinase
MGCYVYMADQGALIKGLESIINGMLSAETEKSDLLGQVQSGYRASAGNLIDYLALRSENIETLQEQLHFQGLSSLTHSESHIRSQLINTMAWLGNKTEIPCRIDATSGQALLSKNVTMLFGDNHNKMAPSIMVTFDTEFADDGDLVSNLMKHGMRIARINCAHDDQQIWMRMIENVRQAEIKTGLPCKIYMDLAGPKIRTQVVSKKGIHGKFKVEVGEEVILADLSHKVIKHKKFIACTLPGIIEHLEKGQRVFFDDGLFEAEVVDVNGKEARLRMLRVSGKKPIIKSEKGINFPDTAFNIDPLNEYDKACLTFIVKHADMVGFSFVNTAADMEKLQTELKRLQYAEFPVIAKIETRQAVDNLPAILLQGMMAGPVGVMIARGDLAIEIGFERLGEIQDEILWICEAAHIPVIWATQVLESLQKQGLASRSEITDAVHAASADCVMINKGEHTNEALKSLTVILENSRKNSFKYRKIFRKLSIAESFIINLGKKYLNA